MSKWNPDEHLPECGVTQYPICICDRLRACEQRVKRTGRPLWHLKGATWGHEQGWNEALDAAREAISNIPKEDGGYCHVLHACDVEAAIDALQSNS